MGWDSRKRRTGRHPEVQIDRRHPRDLYTKGELEALSRAMRLGIPARMFEIGERAYSNPKEAARALGLSQSQEQIAERLMEDFVADIKGQYEIAREAFEADIPAPAVQAILRRGQYMRYRSEALAKSKAMPEGTKSKHGGKPVVKRGGKWVPDTKGGGGKGAEDPKKGKKGHPDGSVSERFEALKKLAAHHKINVKGDLRDDHDHKHLDKLEDRLNEQIGKKKKDSSEKEKKARPSPDTPNGKQALQQEVGDLMDKLSGVQHRIDDDHQPMFERLIKEGKDVAKNPSGEAISWFESRVNSFVHLATGKTADGGDDGAPPGAPKKPEDGKADPNDPKTQEASKKIEGVKKFFKGAVQRLKHLAEEGVHRLVHAVKHTAEEFPTAAKAVGKIIDGEPLSGHDRHALVSVGVTLGSVALAAYKYGAGDAADTFGEKMLMHVATAAVHQHLATAYVGYSALKLGKKVAYIMDLIGKSADKHVDEDGEGDFKPPAKGKKPGHRIAQEKKSAASKVMEEEQNTRGDNAGGEDDEVSKDFIEFAHGVIEQLTKLLERDWSDEEIDYLTADSDEEEEEMAKSAVYIGADGSLVLGSEIVEKARGLPVGTVSTYASGERYRKEADGSWKRVGRGGRPVPRKPTPGRSVNLSKEELDQMLRKGTFSVISAGPSTAIAEEKGRDYREPFFEQRHEKLRQDLEEAGFSYTEVIGDYFGREKSIIVWHKGRPDRPNAFIVHHGSASEFSYIRQLGKKYKQESVIHARSGRNEMSYTYGENAGKLYKGKGFHYVDMSAETLWTEYKTSNEGITRFALDFDFDTLHGPDKRMIKALTAGHRIKAPPPPKKRAPEMVIEKGGPPKKMLELFGDLEPMLKSKQLFTQLVDGRVKVSGDLEKAGIPAFMLPHAGAKTMTLDRDGVRDLIKALED